MLPTSVRPTRNQRFRRDYVIGTIVVSCLLVLFVSMSKMKSSPSPAESIPSKMKEAKTIKTDVVEEPQPKVWNLEDTRFARHSDQLNNEIGQFCEKMDRKLAICHISSMISPRLCTWMHGEINDDKATTHPWTTHETFSHGEKALDMIDSISYTLFDRFYNSIVPIIRERYDVPYGVLGINDASAVSGGSRLNPIPFEDHFHSSAFALILILETTHDSSPSMVTLDSQYLKSINHFTISKNASTWVEHVHHGDDEYAEIRVSPGDLIVIPGVYFLALKQYTSKIINCKSAILMEVGFNRYDSCRKYYFRDSIESTEHEGVESSTHHHAQQQHQQHQQHEHQHHQHQQVGGTNLHSHDEARRQLVETDVTNIHGQGHGHGHADSQLSHSDHSHNDHNDHGNYQHHDLLHDFHDHHGHHGHLHHHDHDHQDLLSHQHDQHQQYSHDHHSQDGEFCSL